MVFQSLDIFQSPIDVNATDDKQESENDGFEDPLELIQQVFLIMKFHHYLLINGSSKIFI